MVTPALTGLHLLQGRNVESFDHVKRDLKIEDEDEAAKDPAFFLKTEGLSEDMKRVMAKLYTPDALKAGCLCPHTLVSRLPAGLEPDEFGPSQQVKACIAFHL